MTREVKSIFLVMLTLIVYATSIFVKDGNTFVFPFPLNPFIFFIVAVQFGYWHRTMKTMFFATVLTAMFGVLSSEVFWEIVLSVEKLEVFYTYPWIYWFYLLQGVGLISMGVVQAIQQKNKFAKVMSLVGIVLIAVAHTSGLEELTLIAFAFMTFTSFYERLPYPIHLLWLLLSLLECTKWYSYLFS